MSGAAQGIDVLVPTCHRPAALAVTLVSLGFQTWPSLRIVVADQSDGAGAEAHGEVQAVLRYLRATGRQVETWRNLPRRGMAQQRAFLLDRVEAPYCLFVDDDVILEPDLVAAWPGPLPMPELAVTAADRSEAAAVMPSSSSTGDGRLAVLQPGATDPRRCWPAQRFAALGDRLAAQGMRVAVNGSAAEAALVEAVVGGMRHPAMGLAGKLGLGGLCGLLERASLVVSNDTGPLHLALALGVPSVGIFWLTNLIEGMPLRQSCLRAALSLRTRCPVCGKDNTATRCAHDESFVADLGLEQVERLALSLLAEQGHQ